MYFRFQLFPRTRREWIRSFAATASVLAVSFMLACGAINYMGWMPGRTWRGPLPAMTEAQTDLSARLRAHVEMLAGTIGPRHVRKPAALEAAAVYIEAQFAQTGLAVTKQEYPCDGVMVRNIIAERRGAKHPERIVVIGAHYDSAGPTPAADDNGSGVAAMVELARLLSSGPTPDCTLRFVAFVNEEPPFFEWKEMGSLVYARACRERGDDIIAMLALETMGYYRDEPGTQHYPFPFSIAFPSDGNFIAFVGDSDSRTLVRRTVGSFRAHAQFPSEGVAAPAKVPGVMWSDHWSFRQCGYTALMVTDTAFNRNPHYHEPTDTPEKLDYDRLARVTEGLGGAVMDLAAGETAQPSKLQPTPRTEPK